MYLADFHIHSNYSDGKHTISEIVDFYGSREFGAIAITDHLCETKTFLGRGASYLNRTLTPESFKRYLELIQRENERAQKQYGMVVIPGFEITKNYLSNHRSAHMLGIGVSEYVSADLPIEEILLRIREQGALTIAAHPVSTNKVEKQTLHLWNRRDELAALFDAWEVASGPVLFEAVARSGLPMIANTDLHRFEQINAWKTLLRCEKNPEAIFNAIRKQDIEFRFYQDSLARLSRQTTVALNYA